jgi:hypothetical protein
MLLLFGVLLLALSSLSAVSGIVIVLVPAMAGWGVLLPPLLPPLLLPLLKLLSLISGACMTMLLLLPLLAKLPSVS